jgi:FtsP/CotA-like multicopper oxidase with cupredoxin domain
MVSNSQVTQSLCNILRHNSSHDNETKFLKYGVGASAALALPWLPRRAAAAAGMGGALTKYIQPLPLPGAGIVVAAHIPMHPNQYAFTQREIAKQLHPDLPPTPLWAYDDGSGLGGQAGSFGLAVVAESGTPLDVSYTNDLPATYPDWIPVDTRLTPLGNQVRAMTHLHGAFVAADSDGNPAITRNGFGLGDTQNVYYPNEQPATLLWFHDHALGATRLNVFAGLAAGYILRDEFDTGLEPNRIGIPGGAYEIPLVIQDRQFNPDGTFLYPTSDIEGVTWIGEYFGDVMLVNGKVWPFFECRAAHVSAPNLEWLQRPDPGPRHWRSELLANRRRRWHVGHSRAGEKSGDGRRRACRCNH